MQLCCGVELKPTLFRAEVLQHRQAPWLGRIELPRHRMGLVAALAAAAALALAAALVVWGEYARKVHLTGTVVPTGGLLQVQAQTSATRVEVMVSEGQLVRKGVPLMRLHTDRVAASGASAALHQQAIIQRRTSLLAERHLIHQGGRQRKDALQARLRSLQSEERQQQAELETLGFRVGLAERSLQRQIELASSGFVSSAQVQQKQEEHLELELRQRGVQRQLHALHRDVQALASELLLHDASIKTSFEQVDRQLATLDQEEIDQDSRASLLVTAPHDGRVAAIGVTSGQSVQMSQWLLSLVPDAVNTDNAPNLEVQLMAPSRAAGFLQPGQSVWLRYSAFAYQKFGMSLGQITAVSQAPVLLADANGRGAAAEALYRVTVALDAQSVQAYGRELSLRPGMTVEADVLQDRRALWEWILEPALAAHQKFGRVAAAQSQGAVP